jgi:hypothetical protein
MAPVTSTEKSPTPRSPTRRDRAMSQRARTPTDALGKSMIKPEPPHRPSASDKHDHADVGRLCVDASLVAQQSARNQRECGAMPTPVERSCECSQSQLSVETASTDAMAFPIAGARTPTAAPNLTCDVEDRVEASTNVSEERHTRYPHAGQRRDTSLLPPEVVSNLRSTLSAKLNHMTSNTRTSGRHGPSNCNP